MVGFKFNTSILPFAITTLGLSGLVSFLSGVQNCFFISGIVCLTILCFLMKLIRHYAFFILLGALYVGVRLGGTWIDGLLLACCLYCSIIYPFTLFYNFLITKCGSLSYHVLLILIAVIGLVGYYTHVDWLIIGSGLFCFLHILHAIAKGYWKGSQYEIMIGSIIVGYIGMKEKCWSECERAIAYACCFFYVFTLIAGFLFPNFFKMDANKEQQE